MRVTVTGATGLIGPQVVAALRKRGDEVTVLSRDPERARSRLEQPRGHSKEHDGPPAALQAVRWDPLCESAPSAALEERDAVVHLAGENISRRWTASAKRAIRDSRVLGTRHLVEGMAGLAQAERPHALV